MSILILLVSGCTNNPKPSKINVIDQSMPKVEDIKFLAEISEIGFEWKHSFDERVEGYYIYRSNPEMQNGKLQRIATIKDKYSSHFVDTKLKPDTQYYYRFSTYSKNKRESIASNTIMVTTAHLEEPVSFIKAITGLPNRIKLIWRPHQSKRIISYIVQRNEFNSLRWNKLAEVKGRLSAEYIDNNLKDNYVYRYRVLVKTYDGLLSKPSQIVEAGTKPLPIVIKNLRATLNLPKEINLSWNKAVEDDFLYYKIYRAVNTILFYRYLAKTNDTQYSDLINANGKSYYYFVTTVDKDGLESPRQPTSVAGTTLGIPDTVYIISSNHDGKNISFSWESKDKRAVKYTVIKEYKNHKKVFTGVYDKSFNDSDVVKGVEYKYTVVAIDKYGLASKRSQDMIVEIPKD